MAQMIEIAMRQQETAMRACVQGLLAQIAQDYNLEHSELVQRYLTPRPQEAQIKNGDAIPAPLLVEAQARKTKAARSKPDKVCCKGVTAKGQPCKFAALADGFCKKHSDMNNKPEGSKKAPTKVKAQKPRHTHLTEEEPEGVCQVCEDQGNVTRPEMPREDWEITGADEIKARLQKMLADADESEAPEEFTPVPESDPEPEPATEPTADASEFGVSLSQSTTGEDDEDMEARLSKILAEETDDEED
jgi:hypothetical protein